MQIIFKKVKNVENRKHFEVHNMFGSIFQIRVKIMTVLIFDCMAVKLIL